MILGLVGSGMSLNKNPAKLNHDHIMTASGKSILTTTAVSNALKRATILAVSLQIVSSAI
jgi:hypothetical protein